MGTYTAQILVGSPHQNDGGIGPGGIQQIYLSENSRACWVMNSFDQTSNATGNPDGKIGWVPEKPDTILEDGLLFAALHVMRHEDLIAMAPKELTSFNKSPISLGDVASESLSRLRAACRAYDFGGKGEHVLIISALDGSTILSQLPLIADYQFDCEVLTPKFRRSFSKWTGNTKTSGSLAK